MEYAVSKIPKIFCPLIFFMTILNQLHLHPILPRSKGIPFCQVRADTDLFIIDEVGKMELFSSSFFPAVLRILESNIPVLASIPIPKCGRDIPAGTFV